MAKPPPPGIIPGFEEPTAGEILYEGESLKREALGKSWLRRVQAVFQNPYETFNPLRRVESYFFETIKNLSLTPSDRAEEVIAEKFKTAGLSFEEIQGKYPAGFSGGQLRRISIARAFLPNLLSLWLMNQFPWWIPLSEGALSISLRLFGIL